MKKKSSPRLSSFHYKGSFAYSLTLCTHERKTLFNSRELIYDVIDRLKDSAIRYGFTVVVYTFMPDHLHILIKGAEDADLKGFVRHFKQMSGYYFKNKYGVNLWHLSYYDHVIRNDEEIKTAARYILENPVRKGLVKDFRGYPFSGSFEFDIKEML